MIEDIYHKAGTMASSPLPALGRKPSTFGAFDTVGFVLGYGNLWISRSRFDSTAKIDQLHRSEIMTLSSELTDFISNVPLFENLCRVEIETVSSHFQRQHLEPGETLFNQWDRAERVYFVESGTLEVLTKNGPDNYDAVATLGRGRSIGEMCLIDNFPRSATARAKTETTVVVFTQTSFERLMSDDRELGIKILKGLARLMAQNLRKTSSRLADNMLPMG